MKYRISILALLLCLMLCSTAFALEFTDANGRTVTIDNPQRVVSLYNSYGDAWLLSGGTLVGTIADTFEEANPLLTSDVQNLGSHTSPNMELLFSLNPDFVLLASNVASHVEIGQTLEQAGIPCAYFSTPDWHSYMENIALFTQLTDRSDLYQQQVETVQTPIEAMITEASGSAHYGQTTALLLRATSSTVKAKDSKSTVAGNILREMGFVNLADGESLLRENLSMEMILVEDPDYIFVITAGSNEDAAMSTLNEMLLSNPAWNTLTAVRENRYIILDRALFHYHPNERWAESYAFLSKLIKGANP